MRLREQRAVREYGVAIAAAAAAAALTWWATPQRVGEGTLFFAAVMLSAWYGGIGPGLVATAVSGFSTAWLFIDPAGSLIVHSADLARVVVFIAVAILISSLHTRTSESEQTAQRAREEAEAANRAKDRFLAVVSHELRNPLNPVLTLASLWERDPSASDDLRADMATIRRNVELESRLIEDLLDLSRIAAGKLELRRELVQVADLVHDALAVCQRDAQEKKLAIDLESAGGDGLAISGDPVRLRQVVWNLLNNAVKFTPAGGRITVTIAAAAAAGAAPTADQVEICISDNGIGMDPATLARVFESFQQGGREVTRRYGGLGLGLAIAKALTEAHGGTLSAHSDGPGRGARFIVHLPLAAGAPPARNGHLSAAPGAAAADDTAALAPRVMPLTLSLT